MGAWGHPGEPLVAEGPGGHLGPSPVLGGLGAVLGQSWGHLGASLGLSWGHPVSYWASLGRSWCALRASWKLFLGRSWVDHGGSYRLRAVLGISVGSFWYHCGSRSPKKVGLARQMHSRQALPRTKTLIILLMLASSRAGKRGMAASAESAELSMMSCAPRWTAIRSDQKT